MKIVDQGIDPKRFQVIPRNLIFLFDSEGRILLIKGTKDKERWAGVYNGIGGHMELNEDILDAAQRELHEETGIEDAKIYLCGQTAAYRGFAAAELNPVVTMALSAMTAHVFLQSEGYTLIPF